MLPPLPPSTRLTFKKVSWLHFGVAHFTVFRFEFSSIVSCILSVVFRLPPISFLLLFLNIGLCQWFLLIPVWPQEPLTHSWERGPYQPALDSSKERILRDFENLLRLLSAASCQVSQESKFCEVSCDFLCFGSHRSVSVICGW